MIWRLSFLVGAVLLLAGGPMHPDGTMAEMLQDSSWVPSHLLLLAGFGAMLYGLMRYQKDQPLPARTQRWVRLALFATSLQVIETAFHTAAVVDGGNLVAGVGTPILTTHLWLTVAVYPVFGATMVGLILVTAREASLGSGWIAWIGVIGAVAPGIAAPLVIVGGVEAARGLFPLLGAFAAWLLLVSLWPTPRQQAAIP